MIRPNWRFVPGEPPDDGDETGEEDEGPPPQADEVGMCARFICNISNSELIQFFRLLGGVAGEFPPQFNIAPTDSVPVVRLGADGRECAVIRWGLVQPRARDLKDRPQFNARAETVAVKPSFRSAFHSRRCLVPATGFIEWEDWGGQKQPWQCRVMGSELFAMAGIWERWAGCPPADTFAVITVEPNELVRPLHDRMPAILAPEDYDRWLDPEAQAADLLPLLRPVAASMTRTPLSPRINSPRNKGSESIEEVSLS